MSIELQISAETKAAAASALSRLVDERFASRLDAGDATVWGSEAESEAAIRLGWVHAVEVSTPLVPEILAFRDELAERGIDRFVLAGMGGSSLAPELITDAVGVPLEILDTTDPVQVRRVIATDIDRTALIVSSKSGSTLETDSQRRAWEDAFTDAGIAPADRIIVVTDPGSPLEAASREAGYRVFTADPNVGGRYSALTAFGLVPAGLAGADIVTLLDEAAEAVPALLSDREDNPALRLAAALGAVPDVTDKFAVAADDRALAQLPAWIEQLVAESTGKQGTGILPIAARREDIELTGAFADVLAVIVSAQEVTDTPQTTHPAVRLVAPLGAQLVLWEVATAALGLLLGIDPFDQPDVESAKAAARDLLEHPVENEGTLAIDGSVNVRAPGAANPVAQATTVVEAFDQLFGSLNPELGYVAVQVYADRIGHADLADVRDRLARALGRPVTFGWGPRFLHSTGQYHKGGRPEGVFLQITRVSDDPLPIPGRPFDFATLIRAQATGDAQVLADHGLPVLQLESNDDDGLNRALEIAVERALIAHRP